MITRIEIDGFKSLRGFALDCEPLVAVVGPNSVGKSNLFDAMKLLSYLAQDDLAAAFSKGRGRVLDQFSRERDGTPTRTMRLAVELLLLEQTLHEKKKTPFHNRLRYEVEIERCEDPVGSGVERLDVRREELIPIQAEGDAWMNQHPDWASSARYSESKKFLEIEGHGRHRSLKLEGRGFYLSDATGITILSRQFRFEGDLPVSPHLSIVSRELRRWRFLHVDALKLRSPSERAAPGKLGPDGANLPTALAALPQETRALLQVDLSELLPGVRSIEVTPNRDEFEISVEYSDGQHIPARVLSDGTLRLLAFLTALRSSDPGDLIAWEEPENGIFPGRLRMLIEKLLAVTSDRSAPPLQIFLNSHSPAVLAALHQHPDALVYADLVRRSDGLRSTRMRRVSRPGDTDRGAQRVSLKEIERILDSARPEDETAT